MENRHVQGAIEALLFVSHDPVSAVDLARILGETPGDISEALALIQAFYADNDRGIQLREVAGGWRFYTHPAYYHEVEAYVKSWDSRTLSQAALEALAVIAYHQPVTREGVRAVRGVNSDSVISSLQEKGLVKELGREKTLGQAVLFGTTNLFLEQFGLNGIDELPPLEDFAPDEESREFIREKLSGTRHARALLAREQERQMEDITLDRENEQIDDEE